MYKVTLLLALGFAAASAFLQDFQRDLQGTITPTNFTTTCNRVATETCTGGYCCAAVTRNGTAVNTNATLGTCVPAEFHLQAFNVSGTSWNFTCAVPATATTANNALTACSTSTPCANTNTSCCAPRSWTLGGAAGSKAAMSSCITKASSGVQFSANWNITTQGPFIASGSISATCPSDPSTGGDGSFAAAIKVTAVMVLALVAGMFF